MSNDPRPTLSWFRLISLSVSLTGLQFTWAIEQGYGTPYLLSLGMGKAASTLVWLAGPVSGLIAQPVFGAMSDKCTLKLGRRRPFMIGGTAMSCICVIIIAFAREIGDLFGEVDEEAEGGHPAAILVAVLAFWILDFCINMAQGTCRALVADISPLHQQGLANALAGAGQNLGNVVGYAIGFLDLPAIFGLHGKGGQMRVLCLILVPFYSLCVAFTCFFNKEIPITKAQVSGGFNPIRIMIDIFSAIRYMPRPVWEICRVQLFTWMCWFPVCFYATTWISQYYADSHHPFDGPEGELAAREGALGFLGYSIISTAIVMIFPPILHSYEKKHGIGKIKSHWIWSASMVMLGVLCIATFFVWTGPMATVFVVLFGIPYGVAMWIPWGMLGEYVASHEEAKMEAERKMLTDDSTGDGKIAPALEYLSPTDHGTKHRKDLPSGMVFGIHNVFIVFPEMVAAIFCGVLFAVMDTDLGNFDEMSEEEIVAALEKDKMVPGDGHDALGWALRLGGLLSLIGAYLALRIKPIRS